MRVLVFAALVAFAAVAAAQTTSSTGEEDVAATLGAKWGHWTLERLRWKRQEIVSDLAQNTKEKARVISWGKKVCGLVREIGDKKVEAAKEGVSEWTDILAVRRSQRGYHVGRSAGYDSRHVYITQGPKSRRAATDKKAWCAAHQVACDRWHHERRLYFKNKFQVERSKHAKVTAHSRKRVQNAKANLAKAQKHLAAARVSRKNHNVACHKMFQATVAKWTKRQGFLKTRRAAVNIAIKTVKKNRADRLATYKPFYMTKCRYIGGKHHMYYCYLDTNNATKAHHRFRVCKHRGVQSPTVGKLKFRCYK